MARAAKPKKEISMEEALWKSADKLRGSVEPAEYKHVVLSLFFLKFASDKFEECRNKIIATHGEKYADMKPFYTQENVFYLPEESRWKYIIENAKQDDIALKIDTALYTIEKNNPALKGALPDNYYSRLHIDTAKLASLLDEINRINTDDKENDIIGRVYEYFLIVKNRYCFFCIFYCPAIHIKYAIKNNTNILLYLFFTNHIIFTKGQNPASIFFKHIENKLNCCRFSCSIRADKPHNIPLWQCEANIIQRKITKTFAYIF